MAKRRHLTPAEIIAQCKAVARESRMADRTPWTAMGIMCAYVILKVDGFKERRILKITEKINELEVKYWNGDVNMQDVSKRLYDKAGWTIEYKAYTEADIAAKKGSYKYWLDSRQIAPQNTINEQATRYMLFFFNVLMDEYGYGKERLTRVEEYMNHLLTEYQQDKTTVHSWKKELLDETGIVFEMPIDPLTQTSGSLMTN